MRPSTPMLGTLGSLSRGLGIGVTTAGAVEYGIPLVHGLDKIGLARGLTRLGKVAGPTLGIVALGVDISKLRLDLKAHASRDTLLHDKLTIGADVVSVFGPVGFEVGAAYTIYDNTIGVENTIYGYQVTQQMNAMNNAESNKALQNCVSNLGNICMGQPP